jgi:hypothetical protein
MVQPGLQAAAQPLRSGTASSKPSSNTVPQARQKAASAGAACSQQQIAWMQEVQQAVAKEALYELHGVPLLAPTTMRSM